MPVFIYLKAKSEEKKKDEMKPKLQIELLIFFFPGLSGRQMQIDEDCW